MNSYVKAVFGLIRRDEILREFAFAGSGNYSTSSTRMLRAVHFTYGTKGFVRSSKVVSLPAPGPQCF